MIDAKKTIHQFIAMLCLQACATQTPHYMASQADVVSQMEPMPEQDFQILLSSTSRHDLEELMKIKHKGYMLNSHQLETAIIKATLKGWKIKDEADRDIRSKIEEVYNTLPPGYRLTINEDICAIDDDQFDHIMRKMLTCLLEMRQVGSKLDVGIFHRHRYHTDHTDLEYELPRHLMTLYEFSKIKGQTRKELYHLLTQTGDSDSHNYLILMRLVLNILDIDPNADILAILRGNYFSESIVKLGGSFTTKNIPNEIKPP